MELESQKEYSWMSEWFRNIFVKVHCEGMKLLVLQSNNFILLILTREPPEVLRSVLTHLIDYIEVVESPKGFLPMALPSKAMVVLLNPRISWKPFPRYWIFKWTRFLWPNCSERIVFWKFNISRKRTFFLAETFRIF